MKLTFIGVEGIPKVEPGDDLVALIDDALAATGDQLLADDVIVIAQNIISKAEDRYLYLRPVTPSEEAIRLGKAVVKDPRNVQAILAESNDVAQQHPGVLIGEQ